MVTRTTRADPSSTTVLAISVPIHESLSVCLCRCEERGARRAAQVERPLREVSVPPSCVRAGSPSDAPRSDWPVVNAAGGRVSGALVVLLLVALVAGLV
eukprot:4431704-Prymnesium_polylepis.1